MTTFVTRAGIEVTIRPAIEADAEAILSFARELFVSTDQVVTVPEEFTITPEQEKSFILNHADKPDAVLFVAVSGNKVVGFLNFNCHPKRKLAHTGELGVSVLPAFQKNGIGRALIETLQVWAMKQTGIEKLCLEVFHTNEHAIRLYQQLGFTQEGRKLKAVKQHDGSYADILYMGYFIPE